MIDRLGSVSFNTLDLLRPNFLRTTCFTYSVVYGDFLVLPCLPGCVPMRAQMEIESGFVELIQEVAA